MRRLVLLFMIGLLIIVPTACAKKEPAPQPQPFPPIPTEPSYPQDNDDSYVPMNYYY